MKRIAIVALGVCVLAGAVPEIARFCVDRATEVAVRRAVARLPNVHLVRVHSRGGAQSVELGDVALAGPGWRFDAGRLTIQSAGTAVPGLVAPALARAASVVIDNFNVTLGDTRIVVPHLEARGTELTAQSLAALLDPADPTPPAQRLAKLTAADISAATVLLGSSRIQDPSTGDHLTLKGVTLADVVSGHIGALAIQGLAFAIAGGTVQPAPFETGRVSLDGIDLPLALEIATTARTEPAAPLRPLFGSMAVDGVTIRPDTGAAIAIGAVQAGALRGRPLMLPPSDVAVLLDKPASDRTPADRQILADLVGDVAGSAALDHLEIRDATSRGPTDRQATFKLARAVLDGFELVKLGSLAIEGAELHEQATDLTLGRLVVGGYDGSSVVAVLKQQFAGGADPIPTQVVPNHTSLALADLHFAMPVTPRGMAPLDPAQRVMFDLPMATLGAHVDAGTGAITSQAAVDFAYDVSAGAADPSFRDLVQYGMGKLDLSAGYAATFDPAAKQIRLERVMLDAQDLGRLTVGGSIGNVTADMIHAGQDRDAAMQAAQALVFQAFSLDFANAGIVEKMLPTLAASAKVSVPLFKAQLKAQAEISLTQALGPTPAATRIITAVRSFIDTPKTFSLSVKAPAGLSFSTIAAAADPKALLGALEIQAVANR